MMQTATKIEAIWDRDNGKSNEGWYARVHLNDGQERDIPFGGQRRCSDATVARRARVAVRTDLLGAWRIPRSITVEISR